MVAAVGRGDGALHLALGGHGIGVARGAFGDRHCIGHGVHLLLEGRMGRLATRAGHEHGDGVGGRGIRLVLRRGPLGVCLRGIVEGARVRSAIILRRPQIGEVMPRRAFGRDGALDLGLGGRGVRCASRPFSHPHLVDQGLVEAREDVGLAVDGGQGREVLGFAVEDHDLAVLAQVCAPALAIALGVVQSDADLVGHAQQYVAEEDILVEQLIARRGEVTGVRDEDDVPAVVGHTRPLAVVVGGFAPGANAYQCHLPRCQVLEEDVG